MCKGEKQEIDEKSDLSFIPCSPVSCLLGRDGDLVWVFGKVGSKAVDGR
jgi:hypothetical protein